MATWKHHFLIPNKREALALSYFSRKGVEMEKERALGVEESV